MNEDVFIAADLYWAGRHVGHRARFGAVWCEYTHTDRLVVSFLSSCCGAAILAAAKAQTCACCGLTKPGGGTVRWDSSRTGPSLTAVFSQYLETWTSAVLSAPVMADVYADVLWASVKNLRIDSSLVLS